MPPPRPLHPYRLFHLSARLRLSSPPPPDDYYALLLSTPLPAPAKKIRNPISTPPSSSAKLPPPSTASPIQGSETRPENKISFGKVLSGPSARVRGMERAEKGLGRPREPDNCCMSGCAHCVWDAYREEVEVWAGGRRRLGSSATGGDGVRGNEGHVDEGSGAVEVSEEDLFEGVEVGIRAFMEMEKRLREGRG